MDISDLDIGTYRDAWSTVPPGALTGIPGCSRKIPDNARALIPTLLSDRSRYEIWKANGSSPYEVALRRDRLRDDVPDLVQYQWNALDFALHRRDAALWHVVGSGKTRTLLSWALLTGTKVLYCTRASARRSVAAEIEKWTTVKYQICTGQDPYLQPQLVPHKRQPNRMVSKILPVEVPLDRDALIYVCGYEILPYWAETFLSFMQGKAWSVVFDEVQHVKSYKRAAKKNSETGKTTFNRAASARVVSLAAVRRIAATGTPIRDRPRDLWAELDLIEPASWGSNWEFVHRYADARETNWGGLDTTGSSNESELRLRLDRVVHRVGYAEVQRGIPPKIRTVIRIPIEDQLTIEAAIKIVGGEQSLRGLPRSIALAAVQKRPAIVDLIESYFDDTGGPVKVTVFTFLRSDCDALTTELRKRLAGQIQTRGLKIYSGHGGQPVEERDRLRLAYMQSDCPCILVGTGDAWGEAVALNDTDKALFASLPYTPGQLEQWEGRFHRKGQKKHVEILYTIGVGTVDEYIANILLSKVPAVSAQVDLGGTLGTEQSLSEAIGMNDESMKSNLMSMILADHNGYDAGGTVTKDRQERSASIPSGDVRSVAWKATTTRSVSTSRKRIRSLAKTAASASTSENLIPDLAMEGAEAQRESDTLVVHGEMSAGTIQQTIRTNPLVSLPKEKP